MPSVDLMPGDGFLEVAELIANIDSAQRKESAYQKLMEVWLRKKPDAARAWLETSNVPSTIKDRFSKAAKQTNGG